MNSPLAISENLRVWFREHQYKCIDPFQLDEKVFGYNRLLPFLKYIRKVLKPMHSRIPRAIFSNFSPIYLPKALGLIIGGNSSLYRIKAKGEYLDESYELLDILREIRSPESRHTSWGWPFEWGQGPRYPRNLPLPCVTSPIGHALLDFYAVTKDDKVHLPKCSPRHVFPVDIHDVAQAIITATELQDWNLVMKITKFAIDNMSNKKDEFYYKYFENGKTNQTVFLRWGQAWMFKALSLFLERQNEIH